MDPKSIGTFFWYTYRYPGSLEAPPLLNREGTCREVDPPYRWGECWIWRLPGTRISLVAGRWRGTLPHEDNAIIHALGGRPLASCTAEEIREWD